MNYSMKAGAFALLLTTTASVASAQTSNFDELFSDPATDPTLGSYIYSTRYIGVFDTPIGTEPYDSGVAIKMRPRVPFQSGWGTSFMIDTYDSSGLYHRRPFFIHAPTDRANGAVGGLQLDEIQFNTFDAASVLRWDMPNRHFQTWRWDAGTITHTFRNPEAQWSFGLLANGSFALAAGGTLDEPLALSVLPGTRQVVFTGPIKLATVDVLPDAAAAGAGTLVWHNGAVAVSNGSDWATLGEATGGSFAVPASRQSNPPSIVTPGVSSDGLQVTVGSAGTSVRVGDLGASTQAQSGEVYYATVDSNGTLGRDETVSPTAAAEAVAGYGAMKSELRSVATNVTSLAADLRSVSSNMAAMSAELSAMSAGLAAVETDIDALYDLSERNREEVREANEGVAMALALESPNVPPGATFALSGGIGGYKGRQALATAISAAISDTATLSAGAGYGLKSGKVGYRAGFQIAF